MLNKYLCYPLLIFSLLQICCNKKDERDFYVFCKIRSGYRIDPNKIVISDLKGHILGAFDVGRIETQLKFKVDADIELVNLHLGCGNNTYGGITSFLEVQNGAVVVFDPNRFGAYENLATSKVIRVEGVQSLDSLGFLGIQTLVQSWQNPGDTYASTSAAFSPNQGAIVHGKVNGLQDYRYLYIPDSIMASFDWEYYVFWNQFKLVPAPTSIATSTALPPVQSVDVEAIFPDYKHYISIGPGTHILPDALSFTQPEEVPSTLLIRLKGEQFISERIFEPGKPLYFDMTDMQIGGITSTPGTGFKIASSGAIDLLEVNCQESTYYNWRLEGRPAAFENVILPGIAELSRYISFPREYPTPFWRFTVKAHQFDKHEYEDIQGGFPPLSGNIFLSARSGYFMLEKSF